MDYPTSIAAEENDSLEAREGSGSVPENGSAAATELIVGSEQESGDQLDERTGRRPPGTALLSRPRVSPHERVFMPAMSMELALARRSAIVEFTRKILVRDQDFGEIPGTQKPALLKPGAEKLCNFFGLEPEFTPVAEEIDWTGAQHGGETFCYIRYRCRLLRNGRVLGVGEGSSNSRESRHRYRWVTPDQVPEYIDRTRLPKRDGKRTLSEFGFAIERAETAGVYGKSPEHWHLFREAVASGAARRVERETRQGKAVAWEIDIDATLYRVPNPDIADLVNTIQKMAQKRALVAATLIATSASEFFTQDVEDTFPETAPSGKAHSSVVQAGDDSASRKIQLPEKLPPYRPAPIHKPWKRFGEMRQFFERMRERVGETQYLEVLSEAGVTNPAQFRSANKALECYTRLIQIAEKKVA
jgi:hypothetical protein